MTKNAPKPGKNPPNDAPNGSEPGLDKPRIHPALAQLAVPLSTLVPDPRNARTHDERNIKAVMASYEAHGQRKPIVVQLEADDGTRMVVRAGNGQCEAAKRLGWTHIAAIVIDEKDTDAIAFALRDNRTAELAEWDLSVLGESMRHLQAADVDLAGIGWEPYESAPLIAAEWVPPANTGEDFDVPPKKESIAFTPEQWLELQLLIKKPTAEAILELVKAGHVAAQENVS